jgi:hypothetical protein
MPPYTESGGAVAEPVLKTAWSSRPQHIGAAPESNRASRGLHDRADFEDRLGHRARAAPSRAYLRSITLLVADRLPRERDDRRCSRARSDAKGYLARRVAALGPGAGQAVSWSASSIAQTSSLPGEDHRRTCRRCRWIGRCARLRSGQHVPQRPARTRKGTTRDHEARVGAGREAWSREDGARSRRRSGRIDRPRIMAVPKPAEAGGTAPVNRSDKPFW